MVLEALTALQALEMPPATAGFMYDSGTIILTRPAIDLSSNDRSRASHRGPTDNFRRTRFNPP
jgi:hypothetical protein